MRTATDYALQKNCPVLQSDGTVSCWSFSKQAWMSHVIWVPEEDMADMHPYDRGRVEKHFAAL